MSLQSYANWGFNTLKAKQNKFSADIAIILFYKNEHSFLISINYTCTTSIFIGL